MSLNISWDGVFIITLFFCLTQAFSAEVSFLCTFLTHTHTHTHSRTHKHTKAHIQYPVLDSIRLFGSQIFSHPVGILERVLRCILLDSWSNISGNAEYEEEVADWQERQKYKCSINPLMTSPRKDCLYFHVLLISLFYFKNRIFLVDTSIWSKSVRSWD